ncbi:prolyl oligopeptidase family serine peptidase [Oligella urethralis]|uniref:prolyl oligopeptidase family serine peptidase n=1 Tax=Oligella urethralis TaxID=90245 RepID=UPI0027BA75D3|nr:prolyl oligopeptidase family serine peptidase [Oligella urethralis]
MRCVVLIALMMSMGASVFSYVKAETDPYAWLADMSQYGSTIQNILVEENQKVDTFLENTQQVREELSQEFMARRNVQRPFMQEWQIGKTSYRQFYKGRQLVLERLDATGKWETLLSPEVGGGYYHVLSPVISPNQQQLLLLEDRVGGEQYGLTLWDVTTKTKQVQIDDVASVVAWRTDNQGFYYAQSRNHLSGSELYFYDTAKQQPHLIYQSSKEILFSTSTSGQYLIADELSHNSRKTMLWDLSISNPQLQHIDFAEPQEFFVDHAEDGFYARVLSSEGAHLYFTQALDVPWEDITPSQLDDFETFVVLKDWVVVRTRRAGVASLKYWHKKDAQHIKTIQFAEQNYMVWVERGSAEDVINLGYTSITTPKTLLKYNLLTQKWLDLDVVKDGHYQILYRHIQVRDGTKVPVTIVFPKKPIQALLFTVYGAYGHSLSATYGTTVRSMLDRGFAYILVHVRGGGELGHQWHESGRALQKQNSINDFVDVAFELKKQYQLFDSSFAIAESAGALVVAASVNAQPDLFKGVVLQVPFLDVVESVFEQSTEDSDEWITERNKQNKDYVTKYSPYQQLKEAQYPAMLLIAAMHDQRTPYWHALKFLFKARDMQKASAPLLLFTEIEGGHAAGPMGRVNRNLLSYQFILSLQENKEWSFGK